MTSWQTQSAQKARRALHAAVVDTEDVAAELKRAQAAGLEDDPRLANAVDAHHEYLDALGSVLSNPRSPLRRGLSDRADRARAAFASVGSAELPATITGWQRAVKLRD